MATAIAICCGRTPPNERVVATEMTAGATCLPTVNLGSPAATNTFHLVASSGGG